MLIFDCGCLMYIKYLFYSVLWWANARKVRKKKAIPSVMALWIELVVRIIEQPLQLK